VSAVRFEKRTECTVRLPIIYTFSILMGEELLIEAIFKSLRYRVNRRELTAIPA
jgi:hypothetical protein